ncbi:MAG: EVE domain-containing protein [Alphaproteobacteria bacterium]|nr:EVE domain-containing protein [Alphaproteobacteria bacterium]
MKYWLMKSEPSAYAWEQLVKDKRTGWNGVRNYQANNNMKAMAVGDRAFFYHSNEGREIVGVMEIVGPWRLDPSDDTGKFGMVDVAPVAALKKPVTLDVIKTHPLLADMVFVRQGRLSVSPVTAAEWKAIEKLGNGK